MVSSFAHAISCTVNDLETREQYALPAPAYWLTAAGNNTVMMFNLNGKIEPYGTIAIMYDLKRRKVVPLTNRPDPYPLPDGDYYTQPNPFRVFKTSDAIRDGKDVKPVFTDAQLELGNYQSVGVRIVNGKKLMTMEIETAEGGELVQYEIMESDFHASFRRITAKPVKACANLTSPFLATPMLSRDGTMLTASVYPSNTTKVFRVEMPSGFCRELADLKTDAGKTSFSFDGTKIAYRRGTDGASIGGFKSGSRIGLYEFDLETKKSKLLAGSPERIHYQAYLPDGRLTYSRKGADGKPELVVIDRASLNLSDASTALELGKTWAKTCNFLAINDEEARTLGERLSPSVCSELIAGLDKRLKAKPVSFCRPQVIRDSAASPSAR
jgi:hypothetical protein